MKVKIEIELDTVQDREEIEALMQIAQQLQYKDYDDEDYEDEE